MKRIQRKRTKGFKLKDLSNNYVLAHRPFKLGNPFNWKEYIEKLGATPSTAKQIAKDNFKQWLFNNNFQGLFNREAYIEELEKHKGKDFVCWCSHGEACHVDVIIEWLESNA